MAIKITLNNKTECTGWSVISKIVHRTYSMLPVTEFPTNDLIPDINNAEILGTISTNSPEIVGSDCAVRRIGPRRQKYEMISFVLQ